MSKDYIPFGDEWKAEINKWSKEILIEELRRVCIERKAEKENALYTPDRTELKTIIAYCYELLKANEDEQVPHIKIGTQVKLLNICADRIYALLHKNPTP